MPGFDLATLLGLLAATCTTIAFVPQAVKAWRTRSTKDISLGMFLLMTVGVFFWLVYGAMRLDMPLIAANAVTLVLALAILCCKLRYG